ncbi:MAG: ankyrin repeat domain-containing protein [Spirochaetaceae bacterium]|nr:ankyrin repeat domain-containing protein [Spirochaetaceae bacterium]
MFHGSSRSLLVFAVLLAFVGGAVFAGDGDLFEAVRENDAARVRALIDAGADVNAYDDQWATPLYYAVLGTHAKIVRLLLGSSADPHRSIVPEGPGFPWGSDAIALALSIGATEIVDVLLESGADPATLEHYRNHRVGGALYRGDPIALGQAFASTRAGHPNLLVFLHYPLASREVRAAIDAQFPEIEEGSYTALDALIALKDSPLASFFPVPDLQLPLASSVLEDSGIPDRYSADKAVDDTLSTSWVEGVEGPGVGEQLAFLISRETSVIEIFPGYGDERYFIPNNRLRRANLTIYVFVAGVTEKAVVFSVEQLLHAELEFDDRPAIQEFEVELPEIDVLPQFGTVFAVIEIVDVYPGTRWDDTCIAEVRVR